MKIVISFNILLLGKAGLVKEMKTQIVNFIFNWNFHLEFDNTSVLFRLQLHLHCISGRTMYSCIVKETTEYFIFKIYL